MKIDVYNGTQEAAQQSMGAALDPDAVEAEIQGLTDDMQEALATASGSALVKRLEELQGKIADRTGLLKMLIMES